MRRLAVAAALVLVPAASSLPDQGRQLFPLSAGSEWTFENLRYGGTEAFAARRATVGFRLEGFPGAPLLRVRWSGQALQAWDDGADRWEPFLRLGAAAGTTYGVDLPQPLWSGVRVTVVSRRERVYDPVLRRTYSGTLHLRLRPDPRLADAGMTDLWLAPGVGPVRWVEQSIAGPVTYALSARS